MNGLNDMTKYVIRLRGLPWNTSQSEVINFLGGCKIRKLQFVTNEQGRATGECFAVLETREDVDLAKSFDKNILGTRYIEIFESTPDAMSDILRKYSSNRDPSNPNNNSLINDNWREPVVRLRGLPYHATKSDITKFFNGMHYIELFKSTYAEARASIINDTQLMIRQKTNGTIQQQGTYTNDTDTNYNNDTINQYDNSRPVTEDYSTDTRSRNIYSMPNNESGSLKRSMPASFTIKLRGVPFQATEKDIYTFFKPIEPIRVEQENAMHGRPPVWYAEFGSREEANEAMTYHKKYLGTRYIELFSLFDDNSRSKMIRS